jgi:hypothetical protein
VQQPVGRIGSGFHGRQRQAFGLAGSRFLYNDIQHFASMTADKPVLRKKPLIRVKADPHGEEQIVWARCCAMEGI